MGEAWEDEGSASSVTVGAIKEELHDGTEATTVVDSSIIGVPAEETIMSEEIGINTFASEADGMNIKEAPTLARPPLSSPRSCSCEAGNGPF